MNILFLSNNFLDTDEDIEKINHLLGLLENPEVKCTDNICEIKFFDEKTFLMEDMAVHAGFFTSKTQARKNNWVGPIPSGYGEKKFGKFKKVFWLTKN